MTSPAVAYRERRLTAQDGLQLYYRDYGSPLSPGTPVVCLGGLTRNSKDYHRLASRLAATRRVVCPDYRGRGRSDYAADWRRYRPEVVLGDMVHLLAANDLHGVAFCGTSYGGLLAMGLAVTVPNMVAGAVLNDIGPEIDGASRARILDYAGQDHPQPDWDAAVAWLRNCFPSLSYRTEAEWRRFAEATYREREDGRLHCDWDPALTQPFLRERDPAPDFWTLFRALGTRPVLAIRGALSDVLSAETLARMAAAKTDLMQVTVPEVGHAPSLGEPEAEQAIDDFLAELDRRAR